MAIETDKLVLDAAQDTFDIHRDLEFADNKKVVVYFKNGEVNTYNTVLEFSTSRYHLVLVLRVENGSKGICIPKDKIEVVQRYQPVLARYIPLSLNTKKPKIKKNKTNTSKTEE